MVREQQRGTHGIYNVQHLCSIFIDYSKKSGV